MTNRIASFLQIRAGEAPMVVLVAALFAFIEIGRGVGGNAADGLFFVRFGVEKLPYMYLILGAVTFFVMLSYAAGLGRFDKRAFFTELLLVLAIVLVVERAAILFDLALLYPILWITVNIISLILGTFVWTVATETCDTRQAKRLFSIFTSAGILGGVVGNFVTGPLAKIIGTENLMLLYAALLLIALALTRQITRHFFKPATKHPNPARLLDEIRVGFDFVRTSPLMQLIAFASVLFSILFFSISFPFNKIVSATFPNEADVAGFLGAFSGATTAVTFLVSLLIANRMYTRIGVVNAVLFLPLVYLAGFVLFAMNFTLSTAIIARFAQMVILGGVAGTAWSTFFNVVPPEKRGQVQSFDSGVTAQIGIAISGILLLLGDRVLTTTQVFIMGMVAAIVCAYLVYRMKHAYGAALVQALRAGFLDVFTATQRGFQYLGADSNAFQTALAGLSDAKSTLRRVSAEILGKLGNSAAIEPLTRALDDSDREVRRAALDALIQLKARDATDAIAARLRDDDASVRVSAVDALSQLAPRNAALANSLTDPDAHVRAHAAVALYRAGERERAEHAISTLLNSTDAAFRIAGLESIAESGAQVEFARVAEHARDESFPVRVAAMKALGAFKDGSKALIEALNDEDDRVRCASATVLQSFDGTVSEIISVLNSQSERAQDAALIALENRGTIAQKAIVDWALVQIPRAAQFRNWAAALNTDDCTSVRAIAYLCNLLLQKERKTEQRVLRALALIGKRETVDLIDKGLSVKNQETRAHAIEALDTLGDKRIARGLIPLLEESVTASSDPRTVLTILTANSNDYLRALAVHAMSELLARDLHLLTTRARDDAAPIVRQAAAKFGGGTMPETLAMLGAMDRILFLRQVPIFGNLAPEDLNQIANIAAERAWTRGEYICREGEIGDELFVIVAGAVRVAKQSNGELKTLRTLQVGEQIGELAILREQPRSASVIAEEGTVRALVIRGDALKAILRDRPEVAMAMLASLAQRLSTN